MAETTTTRLSLRRWSAGTDTPSRSEFDTNFANIETLAAIDKQGTFAARPAAGVVGTYYWDTTNTLLWRDTGSAWFNVGSKALDALFKGSTAASVPLTVDTFNASQSANLLELKDNAVVVASVDKTGKYTGGAYAGTSALFTNTVDATAVIVGKGSASQSANLFELKNNANANQFTVSNTGTIGSSFFRSGGTDSTINASSSTTIAGMTAISGTPVFEVRAQGSGTFNDFMYLKHAAITAGAATRRLGLLMKVGGEDATGAGRSGAVYLRSTAADFGSPSMMIDVQDTNVWEIRPDSTGSTSSKNVVLTDGAFFKANTQTTYALQMSSANIGVQQNGNAIYFRNATGSNNFNWYSGGVHSNSANDPGAAGVSLMKLASVSSTGRLETGRLTLTDLTDVNASETAPTLMIGSASGANMAFDSDEIAVRNNGSASDMFIQHIGGGDLKLGVADTRVFINDIRIHLSNGGVAPVGPLTAGDLWIDVRIGQGLKIWGGSSWILI